MKREIIKVDDELCNGCGECVPNCHEGALKIVNGKVRLVSELLCDGLGACIGHCPVGAITIETREADPFNEVKAMDQITDNNHNRGHAGDGCPGSRAMVIERHEQNGFHQLSSDQSSELRQWPVQMHLINPGAPYFRGADFLLAADCVAFSVGNFHSAHLKGKSLAIACPKLDHDTDIYVGKLTAMIDLARVNTITVMTMEVPCCRGLLQMVRAASAKASRKVPVKQIVTGVSGEILNEEWI